MVSLLNSTDTVEEFEDRIMQKKMKIPKMSIKNSGNSFDNCYGEERTPLRHKKVGCGVMNTRSVLINKGFYSHRHHWCTLIPPLFVPIFPTTNHHNHSLH